jgi:hypothetical protein
LNLVATDRLLFCQHNYGLFNVSILAINPISISKFSDTPKLTPDALWTLLRANFADKCKAGCISEFFWASLPNLFLIFYHFNREKKGEKIAQKKWKTREKPFWKPIRKILPKKFQSS